MIIEKFRVIDGVLHINATFIARRLHVTTDTIVRKLRNMTTGVVDLPGACPTPAGGRPPLTYWATREAAMIAAGRSRNAIAAEFDRYGTVDPASTPDALMTIAAEVCQLEIELLQHILALPEPWSQASRALRKIADRLNSVSSRIEAI